MRQHLALRLPTVEHIVSAHLDSNTYIRIITHVEVQGSTCSSGLSAADAWLGASIAGAAMHCTEVLSALHVPWAAALLTNGLPTTASAAAMRWNWTQRWRDCSDGLQAGARCAPRVSNVTPRKAMPADRAAIGSECTCKVLSGTSVLHVHVSRSRPRQQCIGLAKH
jgi:hypothetical protein